MNLFTQYGIKEVADVTFYSIIPIGDEEIYIPVLFLNTLKISDIDEKSSKVTASSGYGNAKIIGWTFGKDITLKLQDALFTPASMSLAWGGWLDQRLSKFTYAIAKLSVVNKYKRLHYSRFAYPSPQLTDEELDVIYFALNSLDPEARYWSLLYKKDQKFIEENRVKFKQDYYRIKNGNFNYQEIINKIIELIKEYQQYSNFTTNLYNTEVIDRFETCVVTENYFEIDCTIQKKNLIKYLANDRSETYNIFYDEKTLIPFFSSEDKIYLRRGTKYLKWTRYVKKHQGIDDGVLGKEIVINTDTFPNYYKVVGETVIREQKTGKDQHYQFVINKAQFTGDTSINLQAAGEPTVFDLSLRVLAPQNEIMMELKQFDVEEDCKNGGTRIIPQRTDFTQTYFENTKAAQESKTFTIEEVY